MRAFLPLLPLILACDGDKSPGGDGGGLGDGGEGDGGTPECDTDDGCAEWEICEAQACVDGDRNNSVAEAEAMIWEETASGYLNPASDVDYFSFSAAGGEWVKITTQSDGLDPDTALTLRDPHGKVVTSSDDYPSGGSTSSFDSVVYAYLVEGGTYTIAVEDDATWGDDPKAVPVGGADYTYELTLQEWSQVAEGGSFEAPDLALEVENGSLYAVGFLVSEPGETDFLGVDVAVSDAGLVVYGVLDLSGSDLEPRVEIYQEDGTLLSAKDDVGPTATAFYPAVQAGGHVLALGDAKGGGGAAHWGFVFLSVGSNGSAYDGESEPNDVAALADDLEEESGSSSAGAYTQAHVQGWVDAPGDQDWFAVDGFADAFLVACVNSEKWGSSVVPDLVVTDASGAELGRASGAAGDDPNTALENVAVGDETYYVGVLAPDDAVGGLDEWYRLTVYVASFEVASYSCP
jgi:hypothetical protein